MKNRYQLGQDVRPYCRDDTEAERAHELILALRGDHLHLLGLFQHPLCLVDQSFAHRGYCDLVLPSLENLHAQLLLELLNRETQSRLRDEAPIGGLTEVPVLGDGDDVAKFSERHQEFLHR